MARFAGRYASAIAAHRNTSASVAAKEVIRGERTSSAPESNKDARMMRIGPTESQARPATGAMRSAAAP